MVMRFREDIILLLCFLLIITSRKMYCVIFLDAKSRFEPTYIPDMIKKNVDADKNMKMQIINNRIPRKNFKFSELLYKDQFSRTGPLYC